MKSTAAPVGSIAPDFSLPDANGAIHRFHEAAAGKTLLVFFRGFWCETCQAQLAEIRAETQEIADRGGRTIAVSAETVERSREGIGREGAAFLVLCDPELSVISRYDVVHRPDEAGPGIARPAVFVLDSRHVVRFAHVGADAYDRPKLEALLLALDAIA